MGTENSITAAPIIRLRGIRKSFGATAAVAGVDLELFAGEVHGLVGENGAGKSTLMRVLAGMYADYEGEIEIGGQRTRVTNPGHARRLGIALVHQELSLVPELSVAENIFLGREPAAGIPGFISRSRMVVQAEAIFREMGVDLDPKMKVSRLSAARRQLVEIAKGLAGDSKVLILDEPTSSLTSTETRDLFRVLHELKKRGAALVYISHKLDEVFAIADRITVMRDGQKVATGPTAQWNEPGLVKAMVGRELTTFFPRQHRPDPSQVALGVRELGRPGAFREISFELHRGEVLGMYGLIGAGRSDVAAALFGLTPAAEGEITVFGRRVKIRSPRTALAHRIALVPEDRRERGLVLMHSVGHNLSLPVLRDFSSLGFIRQGEEKREVLKMMSALGVRAAGASAPASTLSGGNQQKVVIGKWLMRPPAILILDEPTRGIDVGAKAEVHAMIDRLASEGLALLLISSEIPEVLGMSDRVLVMREGRLAADFSREQANPEKLGAAAAGASLQGP